MECRDRKSRDHLQRCGFGADPDLGTTTIDESGQASAAGNAGRCVFAGHGIAKFLGGTDGQYAATLGLSGWTANDWTRGSAVQMPPPRTAPSLLQSRRRPPSSVSRGAVTVERVGRDLQCSAGDAASVMNQLALRGQAIFDLDAGVFRWRQSPPDGIVGP